MLHFVASKNQNDLARKLLAHDPPVSARVRDKRGQYAIHRAAAVGSVPMVKLLLKHRSPINATDSSGYTPLHHAVAEGHGPYSPPPSSWSRHSRVTDISPGDTAVALLKEGAETDKKDADGYLALQLAPDKEVGSCSHIYHAQLHLADHSQVRRFIERAAEAEGIEL